MWELCPIKTPGRPGTVTPVTARPGAASAAWNQMEGMVGGGGGSPPSIAPPPATAPPLTAHALLSGARCTRPAGSPFIFDKTDAAAIAAPAPPPDSVAGPDLLVAAAWAAGAAADACGASGAGPRYR